jgi:hypothetical protein
LVVAFVLALLAVPAAAQGATKEVTVTGDRVISSEVNPENPHACSTIAFYEWSDVPNTTAARVTWTNQDNGKEYSEYAEAPFHDALTDEKPPRYAPPGRHRIIVGFNYGTGPAMPNYGCRDVIQPRYEKALPPTAPVVLTVTVDEKACDAAEATLKKRSKAVKKLKRKVRDASGPRKDALRNKLRKAKKRKRKAADRVSELC